MSKKILIISSNKLEAVWQNYFSALQERGHLLFSFQRTCLKQALANDFLSLNNFSFFKPLSHFWPASLFFLLRPLLYPFSFLKILYAKLAKKIDTLILFGWNEKLALSGPAKLLGLNIIWIETPGKFSPPKKPAALLIKNLAKKSKIITLAKKTAKDLSSLDIRGNNVHYLPLGIQAKKTAAQENIFSSLAKQDKDNRRKKYYSIGTILELSGDLRHLEKLLYAVKNCLSIIPHIQLIVAGEGTERKNMTWLAKKMGISNLIWFVGNHKHVQKWLNDLDLYILACRHPKARDIEIMLTAMSLSLPIIAPTNIHLNDYLVDKETCLFSQEQNSDSLAEKIIKLQQNKILAKKLGLNAKQKIAKIFNWRNSKHIFCDIIES